MLEDAIEFVKPEIVAQIVNDNTTNFKATEELLMQKREYLYWTP